jgi:hypothetical protein
VPDGRESLESLLISGVLQGTCDEPCTSLVQGLDHLRYMCSRCPRDSSLT